MRKELDKVYNPKNFEEKIYKFWVNNKYFNAKRDKFKKPYTIVMPPPNITGHLHMGHALDNTLQDILIRWRRMQGYCALWLPGTDHASIATESKIVEDMKKENLTKEDLGREKFLERAWKWKEKYGGTIISQLKKLGCSCDWERERFTLDEGCSFAVKKVFVSLYNKNLIYRSEKIINWCPNCMTSISDAEVEHEQKDGFFWHINYPLADNSGFLEIATTRPETLLGDTAVAVNPNDIRYKHLIGKNLILPLVNKEIPIIADDYVDMEFGTGCVKITPAHDPNDFEVGIRHNLPIVNIMNDNATINKNGGKYQGLDRFEARKQIVNDRFEARKQIVNDLKQINLLVNTKEHSHNVGCCYRCSSVIEPKISLQWFVKMKELAEPAIQAVKSDKIEFIPKRFEKIYFHWMENIKDWCISRQLWWGHKIPAYYCKDCDNTIVAENSPNLCSKCGSKNIYQDSDSLDTWFSSALWPFSTLGWPNNTEDLEYFYPTSTLVTGYDIIFFWVSRMIFSALKHTNNIPFKKVLIHGIVRDEQGRKMSKSLGNGIDPLNIIDLYGADALRYMLASGTSPGNDMRFFEEKVKSSRNFANKLWNATRFIIMNVDEDLNDFSLPKNLKLEDKWVISRYNSVIKEVTENLENFELGIAVSKIFDFTWDILCDWYIEICKSRLQSKDDESINCQKVLLFIMTGTLKLLHPFMPFITEEIWQCLVNNDKNSIMVSNWPEYDENLNFETEENNFGYIIDSIKAIRNSRAEKNIPPSKKSNIYIETVLTDIFNNSIPLFEKLAYASSVSISEKYNLQDCMQIITEKAKIFIPINELINKEQEIEKLLKNKSDCENDIKIISSKLNNPKFIEKAPANIVEQEKQKLKNATEKLNKIQQTILSLK